jgi:hypothetical protein
MKKFFSDIFFDFSLLLILGFSFYVKENFNSIFVFFVFAFFIYLITIRILMAFFQNGILNDYVLSSIKDLNDKKYKYILRNIILYSLYISLSSLFLDYTVGKIVVACLTFLAFVDLVLIPFKSLKKLK